MLSFNGNITIEFEVYCNTCGEGLCYESTTTIGKTRGIDQVRVNVCPYCMDKKDDEISDLKAEIEELNKQLNDKSN